MYVFIYVCVYLFIRVTSPGQTKNDTDLKFGTHTLLTLSKNGIFVFSKKTTLTAASLKKLPCHVDFPHISSIALFLIFISYFELRLRSMELREKKKNRNKTRDFSIYSWISERRQSRSSYTYLWKTAETIHPYHKDTTDIWKSTWSMAAKNFFYI